MTDPARILKWSAHYAAQRRAGEAGWASSGGYRLKQAFVREALRAYPLQPGAAFLELGCGAGNITLWMAEQGFAAAGVDVSPEAVAWARARAARAGLAARFELADLADMRCFEEGAFDLIYDGDCLHMIPDPALPACLAEVRRVLKPGGRLIAGGNMRADSATDPRLARLLTPDGFEYFPRTETEWRAHLESVGFTIAAIRPYPKKGTQAAVSHGALIEALRPADGPLEGERPREPA